MSPIVKNNISVYPVPVNDILHIMHNHNGSTNFEVINQIGSIVISGNLLPNADTINLENLPAGIYFLRLQGESFNAVKRFSKD
jgi:hypothetical protein